MAAMPSITIVKQFVYRGQNEEFSNTYHFDGGDPATDTAWKALADAVIAAEKTVFSSGVSIIRAYGHKAGVKTRAWVYDYLVHSASVAGTGAFSAQNAAPGDAAVWLRWPTTQFTSRGKPIYLRSYFHDVYKASLSLSDRDNLLAAQKTALETYGAAWIAGFSDGSAAHHRAGPNGAIGQSPSLASSFITTRTLERRGKRRPT